MPPPLSPPFESSSRSSRTSTGRKSISARPNNCRDRPAVSLGRRRGCAISRAPRSAATLPPCQSSKGIAPIAILNRILSFLDRVRSLGRSGGFGTRRLRSRERYRPDYEIVARSVLRLVEFETAYDVGCANGFLLSAFHAAGKCVRGIDLSPDIKDAVEPELVERVEVGDFAAAKGSFDLVCCVEVAEHIRPERSHDLVETITSLATQWIYFSAAPPGQLGRGHINCRPHEEWLGWLRERGWEIDEPMTAELRRDLAALRRATWLARNSFLLRPIRPRRGGSASNSAST